VPTTNTQQQQPTLSTAGQQAAAPAAGSIAAAADKQPAAVDAAVPKQPGLDLDDSPFLDADVDDFEKLMRQVMSEHVFLTLGTSTGALHVTKRAGGPQSLWLCGTFV
jgi:hypothetical protein